MFMKLKDICTIYNISTNDGWDNSFGSQTSVTCEYFLRFDKTTDGSNRTLSGWAIIPSGTSIDLNSKIVFPDGSQPKIKKIHEIKNFKTKKVEGIKLEFG